MSDCPNCNSPEQAEAPSDVLKTLLNNFERQAQRFGELWERCQGKGWPEKESNEFHSLRDDRMPKTRAALLKALATQPTASNAGEREAIEILRELVLAQNDYNDAIGAWGNGRHVDKEELRLLKARGAAHVFITNRAALASKPPAGEQKPVADLIEYEAAHRIAFQAARAFRPPYYGDGFRAHTWVVEAVRSAHMDGQRHARGLPPVDRGGEMLERPATQPTASNAGTTSDWDSNPDGIKPGQDSPVRMDPGTGAFDAPEEYEGRDGSNPSNVGEMIAPAQTAQRAGAPHPTASPEQAEAPAIGHIRDALLRARRYVPPERESQMVQALSELEALATKPPAGEQKPVGFMSAKQLPWIADPGAEGGVYIPIRKTPAGLLTLALYTAPQPEQVAQDSAVLAYLDDLKDDAIAHIWPDDLERCQTHECTVTVASVRLGSPNGHTLPLFSRKQVADALRAARARGESKS